MKRSIIIVVWLLTTAWFIRFEAFPQYFTRSLRGYRDFLPKGVIVKDSWMKIVFKNAPVGYSHTKIETDETMVSSRYRMDNQMVLNLTLMGVQESISVGTEATLDAMYRLQSFRLTVLSKLSSTRITGRRGRENSFRITTDAGGAITRSVVSIPDDVIIYSPGMDIEMSRLKPGETMSFRTMEPLTLAPSTVTVRAMPRETIKFHGFETNVSVLAVEYMGSAVRSWIGAEGELLRQETILKGLVAEACEADEAMRAGSSASGQAADDLLGELAIKSDVAIAEPRNCKSLRIRMDGIPPGTPAVSSNRQIVEGTEGSSIVLLIKPASMPSFHPAGATAIPAEFNRFLASSAYIQSDNPEIVRQAKALAGKSSNSVVTAVSICDWVYNNVKKIPSPGVPSALEVLHSRKGDCNEHTYLFVALARAAGIPAKVKIGVVYSETIGGFGYHAWPAVYLGDWVEMDPTFGEPTVDATHIALIEGEFADQFSLAKMVGKLSIKILALEEK